ncbi:MAG TPA: hypothetical protein VK053_21185 [Jiangellaceae bacterium]|nr:hypothetical protein [Jiangellaceae bacterium]
MTTAADLQRRSATLEIIVGAAQEDVGGLWRSLLTDDAERAAAGLRRALPEVVEQYGSMAADNAVIWYEDVRPAGARSYRARKFTPSSLATAEGLATWAATPLFSGDVGGAVSRVLGTTQKLVTDHDRETIEQNATRDPIGQGWRRRASADACAYCAYMAVVLDQPNYETAARKYHDNCRCVPVPDLRGDSLPEQPNGDEWRGVFDQARADILRERRELPGWSSLRRSGRSRRYPEYQLTTKNILARARRIEPGLFRDGVFTTAA